MIDDKRKRKHLSDYEISEAEKEVDTMDIYDDDQRNEMLETDEITAAEGAFMQGREMESKDIKKNQKNIHDDIISVELSKKEYEED